MISSLASPSVCVIDDEEEDYRPILAALNGLYVGSVHILGKNSDELPTQPFCGLRLVLTDLHLNGTVGKNAASYTANVFTRLVSTNTAPVVVVIWSKYADDTGQSPEDDQETEAQLFKRTLLEAQPDYKGRLIFLEMEKPKSGEGRPESQIWIGELKQQIERLLNGHEAIQALWAWESLVRESGVGISERLTALAQKSGDVDAGLKMAMRLLVQAQAEGDLSAITAPRHLAAVLAQLLVDQLDHTEKTKEFTNHGGWLSSPVNTAVPNTLKPEINALLLTAELSTDGTPFVPGAIYKVEGKEGVVAFRKTLGKSMSSFLDSCTSAKRGTEKWKAWRKGVQPVLIELSPTCDVAQGHRSSVLLVAGLVVPEALCKQIKKPTESLKEIPSTSFSLRWQTAGFQKQDVRLLFSSRYKFTLPSTSVPAWLYPWFRLRELPTTSLRNWYSSATSRVGYVQLD